MHHMKKRQHDYPPLHSGVLHVLSSPSRRREVDVSWTAGKTKAKSKITPDPGGHWSPAQCPCTRGRTAVKVTFVAGIGGLTATVAGLVARPLPFGELHMW